MKKICTIGGCEKPFKAKGLCNPHYRQHRKRFAAKCSISGCDKPVFSRSICSAHYTRQKRHGSFVIDRLTPISNRACSVEGCNSKYSAKGYCGKHYQRWKRYGNALEPRKVLPRPKGLPCEIPGCVGVSGRGTKGWCYSHYWRDRRHGDVNHVFSTRRPKPGSLCEVPDCDKPHAMWGMCKTHVDQEARRRQKHEAIGHYSKGSFSCKCCQESTMEFLTLDHIANDGNKHRKEIGRQSKNIYRWAIKNNFPEIFQVLCFNCNLGKSINKGICPHQRPRHLKLVSNKEKL